MKKHLHRWLLLISVTATLAKDEELPLCPTNMAFFPQNLPMHCRLPSGGEFKLPALPHMPTMTPFLPNLPADQQPSPLPLPVPPFPGMPGAMPMPMPMMPGVPPQKLPVIVMPFYSPDPSSKKTGSRRPRNKPKKKKQPFFKKPSGYDSDTDTSSDMVTDVDTDTSSDTSMDTSDSSPDHGWWKGNKRGFRKSARGYVKKHKSRRRPKKNKELLTPILQYVTKDGYVIFEKKITKDEVRDWFQRKKDKRMGAEEAADDNNNNNENMGNLEIMDPEDPKTRAEEMDLREKEKSEEERIESLQKKRKHHHRKPNTLIPPVKPTP